jgi:hypothetical protein
MRCPCGKMLLQTQTSWCMFCLCEEMIQPRYTPLTAQVFKKAESEEDGRLVVKWSVAWRLRLLSAASEEH